MTLKQFANLNQIDPMISDIEIIKTFLVKEYNYLLPKVESAVGVNFKEIDISKITLNEGRIKQLLTENLSAYESIHTPIILCRQNILIDGYHRVALAIKQGRTSISAFILI